MHEESFFLVNEIVILVRGVASETDGLVGSLLGRAAAVFSMDPTRTVTGLATHLLQFLRQGQNIGFIAGDNAGDMTDKTVLVRLLE
ncbi:MAG: hypothetical protein P8130_04490 [Deltaproteobacteria bacterium]